MWGGWLRWSSTWKNRQSASVGIPQACTYTFRERERVREKENGLKRPQLIELGFIEAGRLELGNPEV